MELETNSEAESQEEVSHNSFNTVTPLSKYLAMILFITLPFIGFWLGYQYAPEKVVEVEKIDELEEVLEVGKPMMHSSDVVIPEGWVTYTNSEVGFSFSYPQDLGAAELSGTDYSKDNPLTRILFSNCPPTSWATCLEVALVSDGYIPMGSGRPSALAKGFVVLSDGTYRVSKYEDYVIPSKAYLEAEIVNNGLFFRHNYDELHKMITSEGVFNLSNDTYSGLSFMIHDEQGEVRSELLKQIMETVVKVDANPKQNDLKQNQYVSIKGIADETKDGYHVGEYILEHSEIQKYDSGYILSEYRNKTLEVVGAEKEVHTTPDPYIQNRQGTYKIIYDIQSIKVIQ